MKKKTTHSPHKVTTSILRNLGRDPAKTSKKKSVDLDDDDFGEDDDFFPGPEYRSEPPSKTSPPIVGPVRLHPDTTQELIRGLVTTLQFDSDTIRNLAKAIAVNLQLLPETIQQLAKAIYGLLQKDMAALVEDNTKLADGNVVCTVCAVGGRCHTHPFGDMTTKAVCDFTGWKEGTIYTRTQDGQMPPPVSAGIPHTYDPHVIALLRYDGIVFPQARYSRDIHLDLLRKVEVERAKKKADFHEKQSAMMVRENARRAAERAKHTRSPSPAPKRAAAQRSTVRGKTKSKKR